VIERKKEGLKLNDEGSLHIKRKRKGFELNNLVGKKVQN
jgi:hypothetical protein